MFLFVFSFALSLWEDGEGDEGQGRVAARIYGGESVALFARLEHAHRRVALASNKDQTAAAVIEQRKHAGAAVQRRLGQLLVLDHTPQLQLTLPILVEPSTNNIVLLFLQNVTFSLSTKQTKNEPWTQTERWRP